jgi:large subunit ribosomal protein L15
MLSHEIISMAAGNKKRRRVGRGRGSGNGKTSGRGHKGANSRAGAGGKVLFEGGQMPLFRRLPKRGFSNFNFSRGYCIVNVSQLERFSDGTVIRAIELHEAGLIGQPGEKVKILGDGELTKSLRVEASKFSRSAQEKILASGGSVKVV